MKDRILNKCACVSMLFHLAVGVVFWKQQSLLTEKDILPVKLVNEVDLYSVHLQNKPLAPTTKLQRRTLSDKTPAKPKIPTKRASETKRKRQPAAKEDHPAPTPVIKERVPIAEPEKTKRPLMETNKIKYKTELKSPKEELPPPTSAPVKGTEEITPDPATAHGQEQTTMPVATHVPTDGVMETKLGQIGMATNAEEIELSLQDASAINQGPEQSDPAGGPILLNSSLIAGSNPPPSYPKLARRRGWEGKVWLIAEITTNGKVQEVRLEQSSGHSILDKTAMKTVLNWKFRPQFHQNKLIEYAIRIPILFELRSS